MSNDVQNLPPVGYQRIPFAKHLSTAAKGHPFEPTPTQLFLHREMIYTMMTIAQQHGRDFVDDAIRLITVYFTRRTNNLDKVLNEWADVDSQKYCFQKLIQIYGIRSRTDYFEPHPTLSRIAEALPHVSLVMCDQIDSPTSSALLPWVTNAELGIPVHRHFKMNYYPGLVDVQEGGLKAKAGLLLANLCYAKVMIKTSKGRMSPVQSFVAACRFADNLMAQQLAPSKSKRAFTKYVESLPLDARIMNEVWKAVLDGGRIKGSDICLTSFHEQVYRAQPLTLAKWQLLLEENAS